MLSHFEVSIYRALSELTWLMGREKRLTKWEEEFVAKMALQVNAMLYGKQREDLPTPTQQQKIAEIHDKYKGRYAELTGVAGR